ncbi:MAG: phospholipase A, partial [Gammaproteobacteria bacterium]|nr:phospholipase A [Gammaproteobacteria bacterium]NIR31764.1 phospholipase A [Gammaproteobacteria bacterium]NIR98564.1 phospholipase A [Gammaproteobacteria bacterium]NIT64282.1 phospholipase A [Gammaproteobacteria bacterium]NIV21211.1 hypothetical protein [Gammaproteobacteria bacterium]
GLGGSLRWGAQAGAEHISNGRGVETVNGVEVNRSRSWNRVYLWPRLVLGKQDTLIVSVKWWSRISEEEKADPLDPVGDDNPRILDFLGHAELR